MHLTKAVMKFPLSILTQKCILLTWADPVKAEPNPRRKVKLRRQRRVSEHYKAEPLTFNYFAFMSLEMVHPTIICSLEHSPGCRCTGHPEDSEAISKPNTDISTQSKDCFSRVPHRITVLFYSPILHPFTFSRKTWGP